MSFKDYHIILASNSPRRKELLRGLDIAFDVRVQPDIAEDYPADTAPADVAAHISREKANAYKDTIAENELIITADTVVIVGNEILGKPHDDTEAKDMLHKISGRKHQVVTAVCLTTTEKQRCFSVSTDVTFKNLKEEEIEGLKKALDTKPGDMLFFAADTNKIVWDTLGALRVELANQLGLLKKDDYRFLWVTEFPLLEWSEEENRFKAMHHPFTAPMDEDWQYIDSDPGRVRAKAYDIVLNGTEIGGGSVRIHQGDVQAKMFDVLGLSKEVAQERFGYLLDAFKYGVPPHAGLAYGLDRVVMLMVEADSIRDVIAFPKVKDASDLMTNAPDRVDDAQLKELGLIIKSEQ